MRPVAVVWLVVTAAAAPLHAQDAHYWTVKYGPRASLLGGAVIGSVNDVSATFYNPGGLAMADSLGFALSLNVFERTVTTLESPVTGDDVSVSRTGLVPGMFGGAIRGPQSGRDVIAYSFITRERYRTSISGIATGAPPPFESAAGHLGVARDVSESWIGISWAHAVWPNLGIGATGYVTMRFDSRASNVEVAGIQADAGSTTTKVREFDYDHYGVIGKFGALLNYESFAAGLTLTTPSAGVYGSGNMRYVDIAVVDEPGGDPARVAFAGPNDLSATHKRPLSVGLGLRTGGSRYQIYGSAEWFNSVGEYDVIDSGTFEAQSPPGQLEYVVTDKRTAVVNWAVAIEGRLGRTVGSYISFATDQSSNDKAESELVIAPWDVRTLSVGVDFRIAGRSLTLGGAFGWGDGEGRDTTDLVADSDLDLDPGFELQPVQYRSFRLILGFEL